MQPLGENTGPLYAVFAAPHESVIISKQEVRRTATEAITDYLFLWVGNSRVTLGSGSGSGFLTRSPSWGANVGWG